MQNFENSCKVILLKQLTGVGLKFKKKNQGPAVRCSIIGSAFCEAVSNSIFVLYVSVIFSLTLIWVKYNTPL